MITIREERASDFSAIREINDRAFSRPLEGTLVEKLRKSCRDILSLEAAEEDVIPGHILFSPVTIDGQPTLPNDMGPRWQSCRSISAVG